VPLLLFSTRKRIAQGFINSFRFIVALAADAFPFVRMSAHASRDLIVKDYEADDLQSLRVSSRRLSNMVRYEFAIRKAQRSSRGISTRESVSLDEK